MEIIQHLHESVSRSYTLENSDEIPDIEDFNAHNILLVDDPVKFKLFFEYFKFIFKIIDCDSRYDYGRFN